MQSLHMHIQVKPSATPRKKTLWKEYAGRMISFMKNIVEPTKANHIPLIEKI